MDRRDELDTPIGFGQTFIRTLTTSRSPCRLIERHSRLGGRPTYRPLLGADASVWAWEFGRRGIGLDAGGQTDEDAAKPFPAYVSPARVRMATKSPP